MPPKKHRKWLVRLRRMAVAVCLLGILAAILCQSEPLQQAVVRGIVESALGGQARVTGVYFPRLGEFHLETIAFEDHTGEMRFSARGLTAHYALRPENGRHVDRVSVEALTLYRHGALVSGGTGGALPPLDWVPERVDVASLSAMAENEETALSLEGVAFGASIAAWDDVQVNLSGAEVTGEWRTEPDEQPMTVAGATDLHVALRGGSLAGEASVRLPGLANLDASFAVEGPPDAQRYVLDLRADRLEGRLLDLVAAGSPVSLDHAEVSACRLSFTLPTPGAGPAAAWRAMAPEGEVSALLTGLRAGLGDDALVLGDTTVRVSMRGNEGTVVLDPPAGDEVELLCRLDAGQDLLDVTFHTDAWPLSSFLPLEGTAEAKGRVVLSAYEAVLSEVVVKSAPWGTVQLPQGKLGYAPPSFQGMVEASADIEHLTGARARGRVHVSGPLVCDGPDLMWRFDGQVRDGGWDSFTLPPNEAVNVSGSLAAGLTGRKVEMVDATVAMGDGTRVTCGAFPLAWPLVLPEVAAVSDGQPLVHMGYLGAAEGQVTLRAPELRLSAEGVRGAATVTAALDRIALPGDVVVAREVRGEWAVDLSETLAAAGPLAVERIVAGGLAATEVRGQLSLEEDVLHVRDLAGVLIDGVVSGEASVEPFSKEQTVQLDATLANGDLATLTRELKLTGVRLTGKTDTTLSLKRGRSGLDRFRARAESTENFSVNRELVEQALLTQYVGDAIGKTLSKPLRSAIGEAPERPFDSAHLDLRYDKVTGRLDGQLNLRSELLDLYIPTGIDLEVVTELLKMKQTKRMGGKP